MRIFEFTSLFLTSHSPNRLDDHAVTRTGYIKDQEQGSQGGTQPEAQEGTETSKAQETHRQEGSRSEGRDR
jgi:hypothetical protein